jgi:hypothetical protein
MPPLLPCFSPLLAVADVIPGTFQGITSEQAQLIVWGIAGAIFGAVLQLFGFILIAYKTFQKSPALHELYATKEEVEKSVSGLKGEVSTLSTRLDKVDGGFDDNLREIFDEIRKIHHGLGRIEGLEAASAKLEALNSTRFEEISKRLGSIEESMRH